MKPLHELGALEAAQAIAADRITSEALVRACLARIAERPRQIGIERAHLDAPRARVIGYALLGTVFTVVVQGALNVLLTPFGIPTLTAPFVLVTWLFLLPRAPAAAGDDGS